MVHTRTKLNSGCPYCAGQRATDQNNLTFSDNGIFDPLGLRKNPDPKEFLPKSSQKVYWRCKAIITHRWKAPIVSIANSLEKGNNGCPFCSGKKIVNESNSFAAVHSSLLTEWTMTRIKFYQMKFIKAQLVRFIGNVQNGPDPNGPNRIGNRSKKPTGCPVCNGHKCVPSVSLKTTNPSNNKVNPSEIYPNYNKNCSGFARISSINGRQLQIKEQD